MIEEETANTKATTQETDVLLPAPQPLILAVHLMQWAIAPKEIHLDNPQDESLFNKEVA